MPDLSWVDDYIVGQPLKASMIAPTRKMRKAKACPNLPSDLSALHMFPGSKWGELGGPCALVVSPDVRLTSFDVPSQGLLPLRAFG